MIPRTPNMTAAIRAGCDATALGPGSGQHCSWPECSCYRIPKAIHAALAFAVPKVTREVAAIVRGAGTQRTGAN